MAANDFKRVALWVGAVVLAFVYAFTVPRDWLLGTRVVLLVATFFSIVLYMRPDRTRVALSLVAMALAGSSLAMVVQAAHNFIGLSQNAEPWLLIYTAGVAAMIIPSGGNLARPADLLMRRSDT